MPDQAHRYGAVAAVSEEEALRHIGWLRDQVAEGPWYRIEAKAGQRSAELWILDVINPWFEDPAALVRSIGKLDVDDITVHLNSPGGDAFGGIAIYNALRDNPAQVLTVIDGLAASAASLIAMAGDKVRMNRGATMMIHEPAGFAFGPPEIMEKALEMLRKVGDSYAEQYAAKAGGSPADWHEAMRAESWYSAQEAVDAGLADELVADEPPEEATAAFDLSRFAFAYAGRDAAPPPVLPEKPTPISAAEAARRIHAASTKEGAGMDPAKIREALGLTADASDDEVRTALATALPAVEPAEAEAEPPKPTLASSDAVILDPASYAALRQQAMRGDEAFRMLRENECEAVLDTAIKAGKFPPARRDHWKQLWALDPDGTKETINRLAANVIPLSETGFPGVGDETEIDLVYAAMYPDSKVGNRG